MLRRCHDLASLCARCFEATSQGSVQVIQDWCVQEINTLVTELIALAILVGSRAFRGAVLLRGGTRVWKIRAVRRPVRPIAIEGWALGPERRQDTGLWRLGDRSVTVVASRRREIELRERTQPCRCALRAGSGGKRAAVRSWSCWRDAPMAHRHPLQRLLRGSPTPRRAPLSSLRPRRTRT